MIHRLYIWALGVIEVLRRGQWNFLRMENEHHGNVDQYRATRDVPLPGMTFNDFIQQAEAFE
jgi:hypothetical protein